MDYVFVNESWEDYLVWQATDKKKIKKDKRVIKRHFKKSI